MRAVAQGQQHVNAGEPYSDEFQEMDVPATLRQVGFDGEVIERGTHAGRGRANTQIYIARKPASPTQV